MRQGLAKAFGRQTTSIHLHSPWCYCRTFSSSPASRAARTSLLAAHHPLVVDREALVAARHGTFQAGSNPATPATQDLNPNIDPRLQNPAANKQVLFRGILTQPTTAASHVDSHSQRNTAEQALIMVPPTFALVVNKKTRIKMRGALENGKRISLPTRRESYDPLANEELDAVISRLDRAIR
ncbi:hypothetical protein V8E54_011383 [Elaphomyces granulatus]